MFYQVFLALQVKQCAIITYNHGIYELPLELLNDVRLRILGNSQSDSLVPSPVAKMNVLSILEENS